MSGNQNNGANSPSDGPSRKRQKTRGGGGGRGRGGRRGGPNALQTVATSSNMSSTPPASGVISSVTSFVSSALSGPPLTTDTTATSFSELAKYNLHPTLLKTVLVDMNMANMTPVQAETLPLTLTGSNVLAQAKTGTGKTLAFLLPAIQSLLNDEARLKVPANRRSISLLVISPTRELATQIGEEAKRLLKNFPDYNNVQVAFGGTNADQGIKKLQRGCDVLVATPGRLLDYLNNYGDNLVNKLANVQTLVLDEADRLLDMGFLPDIQKIVGHLPPQASTGRVGMLFSATMSERVKRFAGLVLANDYKFVNTIPVGEAATHEHVPQKLIAVPTFADLAPAVLGAVRREVQAVGKESFKAIIFAPTAAQVDFYAYVLSQFNDVPRTDAVHSRLTQSKRTSTTDAFRKAQSGILVATDVVARGLDFPGVTNVIQVGLPSEKEAYIHRLGRTARAGAEGRGCLILAYDETQFAKKTLSMIKFIDTEADLSSAGDVQRVVKGMPSEKQDKTYRAWLGFYKTHVKLLGWTTTDLVQVANEYALNGLGCSSIPEVEAKFVGNTGLKGVPGLNIVKAGGRDRGDQRMGGMGGGRGGGGAGRGGRGGRGGFR